MAAESPSGEVPSGAGRESSTRQPLTNGRGGVKLRSRLIVCGRKHCSRCGCWRHLIDFMPNGAGRISSECRTCHRVRVRGKSKARVPGYCWKGHRLTPENTITYKNGHRRCHICRKEYDARWREKNRKELQEYQRIWSDAKRREDGIRRREMDRELPQVRTAPRRVPVGPFAAWLRERKPPELPPSAKAWASAYRPEDFQRWARGLGLDDSHARKIIREQDKTIALDVVDRVLTCAGESWMLEELYPLEPVA